MFFNRFTKSIARVILLTYLTQLGAPIAHACETQTLTMGGMGFEQQGMRVPSPPRERLIQAPFQKVIQSLTKPAFSGVKDLFIPSEANLDKALSIVDRFIQDRTIGVPATSQSKDFQYKLRLKSLNAQKEIFQLKLSRKAKDSTSSFERLHTATIRNGQLLKSFSKSESTQEDDLLNLFKGTSVHHLIDQGNTVNFAWGIPGIGTLTIDKNGGVFLSQDEVAPFLTSYDLVLKTSGNLLIQSLVADTLTLKTPEKSKTVLRGNVRVNHLHMDQTVINEGVDGTEYGLDLKGGLTTQKVSGQGKLQNYGTLKLIGTAQNPAVLSVREVGNDHNEKGPKSTQIFGSYVHITGENQTFLNSKEATFKVDEKLIVDNAHTGSASFTNKGILSLREAQINREVLNNGSWQAHKMTIAGKLFTNKGDGYLKVLEDLSVNSHLLNEGDMDVKKKLTVKTAQNKGKIKGDELTLEVQEEMVNEGQVTLHNLTGLGSFKNHHELKFQGDVSKVFLREFINKTRAKTKSATITGQRLFFKDNKEFVNDADSKIDVDCLWFHGSDKNPSQDRYKDSIAKSFESILNKGKIKASYISLQKNFLQNEGHIETSYLGSKQSLLENLGTLETSSMLIEGGKLSNAKGATLKVLREATLKEAKLDNRGTFQAEKVHLDFLGTVSNWGQFQSSTVQIDAAGFMTNYGNTFMHELTGSGSFTNRKNLTLTGTERDPAKIGTKTFENGAKSSSTDLLLKSNPAQIKGDYIVVTPENEEFTTHKESSIEAKSLVFSPQPKSSPAAPSVKKTLINKGNIKSGHLGIHQPGMQNEGTIHVLTFGIHGGEFENMDGALLEVEKSIDADLKTFQNNGNMIVEGKFTQKRGKLNNKGTWSHTGDIDLGTTKLTNTGTMSWQKGKWDFVPETALTKARTSQKIPTIFENRGKWHLDRMICSQHVNIHNHKELHLEAGSLDFGDLVNHNLLIMRDGAYQFFKSFINHKVVRLLDHDRIFSQDPDSKVKIQLGEIESQKTYIHDVPTMPKAIRAQGDVEFSQRHQRKRTLDDLQKITTQGRVTFHCSNLRGSGIATARNYEFGNIGHLDLYVDGLFKVLHSFKARTLTLNIKGALIVGESNDKMGTIAATEGTLNIKAHSIDDRFGKIYGKGLTKLQTTKGNINVGAPKKGIDKTTRDHYLDQGFPLTNLWWQAERVGISALLDSSCNGLCNEAYISSDDKVILKSADGVDVDCGTVFSSKGISLIAAKTIHNIAGNISSLGGTRIQACDYKHMAKPKGNYGGYDFPGSGPAVLESLGHIEFYVRNIFNQASIIRTGGKFFVNGVPSSKKLNEESLPSYTEEAIQYNFTYRHLATQSCVLQSAEAIQINTGSFKIVGSMHAPIVVIEAVGKGAYHNVSRTRKTLDLSRPLVVDFTRYCQDEAKNKGILQITAKGEVRPEFSSGETPILMLEKSPILLANPQNQHLYQNIQSRPRLFNSLNCLPIGIQNLFAQSLFGTVAGRLPSRKEFGDNSALTLYESGLAYGKSQNKSIVTLEDLQDAPFAMFIPGLRQVDDEIHLIIYLVLPPSAVNPYQSPGDIVADEKFSSVTGDDQTHLNNQIVAGEGGIIIESKKGRTHLATESYTISSETKESKSVQDVAMPQQLLISEGSVDVSGYQGLSRVGTGIRAKGGYIHQTSEAGLVEKAQLVLPHTVESHRETSSGWFSETETTESRTTHSGVSIFDDAKKSLVIKGGQGIHQVGAEDVAGIEAVYDSPDTRIETLIQADTFDSTSETEGSFSHQKSSTSQQTPFIGRAKIKAPITRFKRKATVNGVLIEGDKIVDETEDGLELGQPKKEMLYSQQATSESALSSSDVGCRGGYEVGVPCETLVNVIERTLEKGEIKLESVLRDKDRTKIIGKFKETTVQLQQWQESWAIQEQVIPTEAMIVIGLGVALLTQGVGVQALAPFLEGVTAATGMQLSAAGIVAVNAGFSAICSQAAVSLAQSGNPLQVARDLSSPSSLKSIVTSMVSAGLCQHIGAALNIDMSPVLTSLSDPQKQILFSDFLQTNALKAIIETPLQNIIGGVEIGDALQSGVMNLGVNTVASYFAYHIGRIYADPKHEISYLEHKALHGGLGAISGWLLNPTSKGLIGGAIGGIVSEVVMDECREVVKEKALTIIAHAEKEDRSLKDGKFQLELYDALSRELVFAKLSGATVAALFNQDAAVAAQIATNAVENNAIMLAIGAGLAIYEIYEIYKTYEREGAKAALKKVGIDVTIAAATAGVGRMVWKVGEIAYPTAELAWQAYIAQNPAFAQVAGKVIAPLKQGASKAGEALTKAASKLSRKILGKKAPSKTVEGLDLAESKAVSGKRNPDVQQAPKELLPGEGKVGTYEELNKTRVKGDNLSAHHFPNGQYMKSKGVSKNDGISMMVEEPVPGFGGRHREIHKQLQKQDISLEPRDALAQSIKRAKTVYSQDDLYIQIRPSLMDVIKRNKEIFPDLFAKK